MKAAQTSANQTNLTSHAKSWIQDRIIPEIIIDKLDGIIEERINTEAKINNMEAKEAKETEGETIRVPEGDIFN